MTSTQSQGTARELLEVTPLVMRAVAAGLRSGGEMPVPVHLGLLMKLCEQPRTLTELAVQWSVSLPMTSNSISALAQRGWLRRSTPAKDRCVAISEVTAAGLSALERVGHAAEARLAEVLTPLDHASQRYLRAGLTVLRTVFTAAAASTGYRKDHRTRREHRSQ